MIHKMFVELILSSAANYILGGLAIALMFMYFVSYKVQPKILLLPRRARRAGFLVRAVNWGVFGVVFISFSVITKEMGLDTWRATARLALLFLMLAEIAYQTGRLGSFKKEISEWITNI